MGVAIFNNADYIFFNILDIISFNNLGCELLNVLGDVISYIVIFVTILGDDFFYIQGVVFPDILEVEFSRDSGSCVLNNIGSCILNILGVQF